MALSKFSPDAEKAEKLVQELKTILDAIMIRNPELNNKELKRSKDIKTELEKMGLRVTLKYVVKLDTADPFKSTVDTKVFLWIPKNASI